jgi:hypothetical protein
VRSSSGASAEAAPGAPLGHKGIGTEDGGGVSWVTSSVYPRLAACAAATTTRTR